MGYPKNLRSSVTAVGTENFLTTLETLRASWVIYTPTPSN